MILLKALTLILILNFTEQQLIKNKVCYDGYGCFEITPPFGITSIRPIGYLPESATKRQLEISYQTNCLFRFNFFKLLK